MFVLGLKIIAPLQFLFNNRNDNVQFAIFIGIRRIMLNTIVELFTIVTNIFLSVGVVIVFFQLIQMKKSNILQSKSLMADHAQRKKQPTLAFYSDIYP